MIGFRKMVESDVKFVNEVRNGYAMEFLHTKKIFTYEESLYWFRTEHPDYWMISFNGVVVGYFRLSHYSAEEKSIVIGADISPTHAGRGIGKKSYQKFMKYLQEVRGIKVFFLDVLKTNTRAINLYKSLGFLTIGEGELSYVMYADRLTMEKTQCESH